MANVFLSDIEWILPLVGVGVFSVGLFLLTSLSRLPNLLNLEISRRVEKSIVIEHETQAGGI
ncbi:MAG: hypothetical protein ACRYGA_05095 [Janthinobacterium lividum]